MVDGQFSKNSSCHFSEFFRQDPGQTSDEVSEFLAQDQAHVHFSPQAVSQIAEQHSNRAALQDWDFTIGRMLLWVVQILDARNEGPPVEVMFNFICLYFTGVGSAAEFHERCHLFHQGGREDLQHAR